ncbi:Helicase [Candidatus Desulfarcum epimagneticum]|uniref:Helicase n=1 Tax=uncultured Desulfobacteraceae bacterium TaxID=218296 RepID=A0A484HHX4_9BACT|nr:Helicase [uncultured Desulfobacteraceae bacterium]
MNGLGENYIRERVADSGVIYKRGVRIYEHGAFLCVEHDLNKKKFTYEVDGNYGDYVIRASILKDGVLSDCSCPYPGEGCKHKVAVFLDITDKLVSRNMRREKKESACEADPDSSRGGFLSFEEIREQAVSDRRDRAKKEEFVLTRGDMIKGEHLIETKKGAQYVVTLYDLERGHCSCPDYMTNRLGICKHLVHVSESFKKDKKAARRVKEEKFPFIDIRWDSISQSPGLFMEKDFLPDESARGLMAELFDEKGTFAGEKLEDIFPLISMLEGDKRARIQPEVLKRLDEKLMEKEIEAFEKGHVIDFSNIRTKLYPYQVEGVRFGLYKKAALIGDEMGLGKTLQAIVIAGLKREIFGFEKILVVTLASLKDQWRREIERFTDESALVIAGGAKIRREMYEKDGSFFKITNYEALLRDARAISRHKPDLVILDEAQRIKNFNTKTAEAVKSIPRKHALVLTGTPLENKLEDIYSIMQFLSPGLLSPLWMFAAGHFMLSRKKKGQILGYRNLGLLSEKIKPIVIRRKKEDVLSEVPETVVNNFYLDLTPEQSKIHGGYIASLVPLIRKKFLTPMDMRRIQELLLKARQSCDSTFLIDRETHISPKLKELAGVVDEFVIQNNRKVVIFTEWVTMLFLIAKQLSKAGVPFVELSGRTPVGKRQALIDKFSSDPACKVFLSSDAGGTGLNLQAADCVINFELPWNPAKLSQRIGRVNRIGQTSKCVNVVNFISKHSIEERILAGIQLKQDLFKGVFEDGGDVVEFSREKKNAMLSRLREMMGEDTEDLKTPPPEAPEIPDDTPHYLNPEALGRDKDFPYDREETDPSETDAGKSRESGDKSLGEKDFSMAGQSPEKIENVLNSGMSFIGGLLEMATGKKVEMAPNEKKMIKVDQQTGEVTMKFRLPGF